MFSSSLIQVRGDSGIEESGTKSWMSESARLVHSSAETWPFAPRMRLLCNFNAGDAYVRTEGRYSSHLTKWRKLRGAGVLAQKKSGGKIGQTQLLTRLKLPGPPPLARLRQLVSRAKGWCLRTNFNGVERTRTLAAA